jgi:sugar-specific transcriptional regulator TrmB
MKAMISQLIELGLSEYEAKVYLSLLRENPATAYEIGKVSGVPTSKVYEILKKLIEKGIITITDQGKTKKYVPIEPDDFLDKHMNMTSMIVESLKKELSNIKGIIELPSVWNITDYNYLIEKIKHMIEDAAQTILITIWKDELELVEDKIRDAFKRNVKIAIVHFGQSKFRVGQVYQHPIEETIYNEKGGRGIVLAVDSREVLMGTIFKFNRVNGVWSRNKGFVTLAEDYVKHDVYIMKIVKRYDRCLQERFGKRYEKLRDIFKDEEVA